MDSLELWTSLTWFADNTDRLEFGPLVTPASVRDPIFTARMGKEVENLSGGRLTLGMGAGWQEREHDTFGYALLPVPERFDRFEESLHVVEALLRSDDPVTFDGEYDELDEAELLPRPEHETPILVGGNGRQRTLPLAARFADEWNGVFVGAEDYADLNDRLDDLLDAEGRDPDEVRRSIMTRVVFGRDEAELDAALDGDDADDLREMGFVAGTGSEVAAQVEGLGDAGADRVMLQWLDVDDLDRLRNLADAVV